MKFGNFAPSFRASRSLIIGLLCMFSVLLSQASAQRLPTTVRPQHYTLTFAPDLQAATFTGVETINVTLAEPTTQITLNALEIAFQSVSITANGQQQTASVTLDPKKDQATFTFPTQLPAGAATLSIAYTGILNSKLRGFYLSKTARRNYAVTQFESTDARRAFPSFDEPAFKATYDISLVIDAADTAISNSAIESDTPGPAPSKHTLRFATTPKMSTYLVAFLVGDFQCTSGESDGVAIRVCSTPDKVALTPYAVDATKFILHYYNNYFGIPYPLKKLDLIAIPDFEAGAMENFGAITFRETALLIDPKTASLGARKTVVEDIAHEMAHQWFGDLVTMQWWDNVWLNEGFATWMSNKPVAAMHPEWKIEQDVASGEDDTLDLDARPTTHPIRAKADTPDEIEQMFDGISYGKASNVLLMVENYLGPETFRQGVQSYIAAHLYGNATAEDFWNAQTAVSHKPVDKIMESLVAQPGEPLLTFSEPANGSVSVSQKRFFLSPSIQPDSSQKWTVPVCIKTAKGPNCQLLTPGHSALNVFMDGMFFANAAGKGYYRTAYAPKTYATLLAHAETGLTPAERISLIGDAWAQVNANQVPVGTFLDLAAALKADPNPVVVGQALRGVNMVAEKLAATPDERAALAVWIRKTFGPVYVQLSAPSRPADAADADTIGALRAQLLTVLGYYGQDPAVIAQARQIADKYLADPASVDGTLSHTALYIASRNGDAVLFSKLQSIFETSTNPELQQTALRMLPLFHDPALVQRSLDYAASGKVRNQDAVALFATPLRVNQTRDQAWKYIETHWDKVQAQFTPEMGSRLVGSTGSFCSAGSRDEVSAFFATHPVAASSRYLKGAMDSINSCIEYRTNQEPNLKTWLAAHTNP
jgi:aminopeptidase N/puromycin-sensitive aminopeptidase